MARYYAAQIESLYFTKDGTALTLPCRIEQEGIDLKKFTKTIRIDKDADGNAYGLVTILPSVPVVLTISVMTKANYDDLCDIYQDALDNESTVTVAITGDTISYSGECIMKAIRFNKFSNNYIDGVRIELETT